MDRSPLVVIGDPDEDPAPTPPPGRRPLGFIAALVAAGAVWALVANSPQLEPALLEEEAPAPFPTTTVYQSALETGGGEVPLPGSGILTDIAGDLALVTDPTSRSGSQLWRIDQDLWSYLPGVFEGVQVVDMTKLPSSRYVAAGVRWDTQHVSSPVILVSDDEGESWLEAEGLPARGGTHRVKEFGGQLILLGWEGSGATMGWDLFGGSLQGRPRIWVSADGGTWTSVMQEVNRGRFADLVGYDGKLVLGGSLNNEARLWTSADWGLSWELVEGNTDWPVGWSFISLAVEPGRAVLALAANDGEFGGAGVIWKSSNLQTWSREDSRTPPGTRWISWNEEALAGAPYWYANESPTLFTSPNAASWEVVGGFPRWDGLTGVAEHDGRLLVMGQKEGQPIVWAWPRWSLSVDIPVIGSHWRETFSVSAESSGTINPIGEGTLIRGGNRWFWSGDGSTWERARFAGDTPAWISTGTATSRGLAAVGGDEDGRWSVWWSADGSSWSSTDLRVGRNWWLQGVFEVDSQLIAAAQGNFNESRLWTSQDGMTWEPTDRTWPHFDSIVQTGPRLVGSSWTGELTLHTSEDGFTWRDARSFDAGFIRYLVDAPQGLIGVAQSTPLLISADFSELTAIELPFAAESMEVVPVNELGIVIRSYELPGTLFYTEDLVEWAQIPLTVDAGVTAGHVQVINGDGLFVAGYDRGEVKVWEWMP